MNHLGFTAVNFITCEIDYQERFEELFKNRAGLIDNNPGFRNMQVLKPSKNGDQYLIVSNWDSENYFINWTKSKSFIEGHKRGFSDIKKAIDEGKNPPMKSDFKTYSIISN